jgi:membrane dipeptidase
VFVTHAGARAVWDTARMKPDDVLLHQTFARLPSLGASRGPDFEPVAYVDGREKTTENLTNICGWLVQHGFDDDAIRAVIGGNVYRALQAVWVSP